MKINSRQRRSNRFVRTCPGPAGGWGCEHDKGFCWNSGGRGDIAWWRKARRNDRQVARGVRVFRDVRTVPCPMVVDETLVFV